MVNKDEYIVHNTAHSCSDNNGWPLMNAQHRLIHHHHRHHHHHRSAVPQMSAVRIKRF